MQGLLPGRGVPEPNPQIQMSSSIGRAAPPPQGVRKLVALTRDKSIWRWFQDIIDGKPRRTDGSIVLLDSDRSEVARWNFHGWPSKWEGPAFNATSNVVAVETLEITREGLEWV